MIKKTFLSNQRTKKKKSNNDLLKFAKMNKIEWIMSVLDKNRGDLKADI